MRDFLFALFLILAAVLGCTWIFHTSYQCSLRGGVLVQTTTGYTCLDTSCLHPSHPQTKEPNP